MKHSSDVHKYLPANTSTSPLCHFATRRVAAEPHKAADLGAPLTVWGGLETVLVLVVVVVVLLACRLPAPIDGLGNCLRVWRANN